MMQLNSNLLDDLRYNLQHTKIDLRYVWVEGLYEALRYRTASEIAFDELQGPSVDMLLSPEEIEEIDALTKKSSWRFPQKFEVLDSIFKPKGYKRGHCGTNRVVYVPLWSDKFVVKVALDRAAKANMPNEIVNQKYLKPFVCKCFDIDKYGNIGVYERVIPILTLDQLWEIRGDVYEIIQKFIKRFVIDDFGTKVFKNWGVRPGFGPVLLDYADMYLIDPETLYCRGIADASDPKHLKYCGGRIGYTAGYNSLVCLDCGRPAKAAEFKGRPKMAVHVPRKKENTMGIKFIDPETNEVMFDSGNPEVKEQYEKNHPVEQSGMAYNDFIINNLIKNTNEQVEQYNKAQDEEVIRIKNSKGLELNLGKAIDPIDKEQVLDKDRKHANFTFLSRNESELQDYEAHKDDLKKKREEETTIKVGKPKKRRVVMEDDSSDKEEELAGAKPQMQNMTIVKPKRKRVVMLDEPEGEKPVVEPVQVEVEKHPEKDNEVTIEAKEVKETIEMENVKDLIEVIQENTQAFLDENENGSSFTLDEVTRFINKMDQTPELIGDKYLVSSFIPSAFLISMNYQDGGELDEDNLNKLVITKEQYNEMKPYLDHLYNAINDAKIALEDGFYGEEEEENFVVIKRPKHHEY